MTLYEERATRAEIARLDELAIRARASGDMARVGDADARRRVLEANLAAAQKADLDAQAGLGCAFVLAGIVALCVAQAALPYVVLAWCLGAMD